MDGALVKWQHSQMAYWSNKVIHEWSIGQMESFMNLALVE